MPSAPYYATLCSAASLFHRQQELFGVQEPKYFRVVVVQRWLRNVQKSVMRVRSWCFDKIKPGSQMPPMHLGHGRRYCLGYGSDMRTEVAANIAIPVFTGGMPVKLNSSQR